MRVSGVPTGVVFFMGVPRYMIRKLIEAFLKWFFCFKFSARFFYRMKFYQLAGEVFESRIIGYKAPDET